MKEAVFAPPAYEIATSCRVATVTTDERTGQSPQVTITTVTVEPMPPPPPVPAPAPSSSSNSSVVEVVVEKPPSEEVAAPTEEDAHPLTPIQEAKDEDTESYCSFTSSASQSS